MFYFFVQLIVLFKFLLFSIIHVHVKQYSINKFVCFKGKYKAHFWHINFKIVQCATVRLGARQKTAEFPRQSFSRTIHCKLSWSVEKV